MGLQRLQALEAREAVASGRTFYPDVIGAHLLIPQLRGFWPMSSVDENGDVLDLSGHGHHLTNNNNVPFGIGERNIPYANMESGAGPPYLSRPDQPSLNTEDEITMGGWVRLNYGTEGTLFHKGETPSTGAGTSYVLQVFTTGGKTYLWFDLELQTTPIAGINGQIDPDAIEGSWTHLAATHSKADGLAKLFLNGKKLHEETVPNEPIEASTKPFVIGTDFFGGSPRRTLRGRAALCFLSAAALPDELIYWLFKFPSRLMV